MIAVDTNILVAAHREDSDLHATAFRLIRNLSEGPDPWAIPAHCFREFFAIVTRVGLWKKPTPPDIALSAIESWTLSPTLELLYENEAYWRVLCECVLHQGITGAKIHDAHIAAVCLANGVDELWSRDRDFSRFPKLNTRNPFG